VTRTVCVLVCCNRFEARTVTCLQCVTENQPETVRHKERYCELVAYQTTVKVPVCTSCAAPCCK